MSYVDVDELLEEFHEYWMRLVATGHIENVFAFERVFSTFKSNKGMV